MVTKQVGIRIRVEKQLRDEFQSACLAENRRASEVLREFMRAYAQHHVGGLQASLFPPSDLYSPKESND
jgi:hypothetical protein